MLEKLTIFRRHIWRLTNLEHSVFRRCVIISHCHILGKLIHWRTPGLRGRTSETLFHKRLTTFIVVVKTPSRVSFDSYPGNKYRHFFINVIDHIKFHMVLLAHDCIHVRLLNTQPPSSKPYLRCQKFLKNRRALWKCRFFKK